MKEWERLEEDSIALFQEGSIPLEKSMVIDMEDVTMVSAMLMYTWA
jgi:hypothetical protein